MSREELTGAIYRLISLQSSLTQNTGSSNLVDCPPDIHPLAIIRYTVATLLHKVMRYL